MGLFTWNAQPSKIFVGDSEVSKVFVWDTQVRPSWWGGWQPWANTLAYYPLETDTNDYSWNGRNGTNNWVTFSNWLWVFNGSSYVSLWTWSWTNIQTNMTISVWFKWNGSWSKDNTIISKSQYYMPSYSSWYYAITIHETDKYLGWGYYSWSDYNMHPMNFRSTGWWSPTIWPVVLANRWYHVVITNDWTTKKAYIDGVLYATENISSTTSTASIDTRIGSFVKYNYDSYFNWNISNVILENKTRTDQEVADYYNQTKDIYWWQPWANTYIYYPLTSDLVDVMWNWDTWTMHWTCTFNSTTWITFNWANWYVTWLSNWIAWRDTFTQCFWAKYDWSIDNYWLLIWNSSNYNTNSTFVLELWWWTSSIKFYHFIWNNDVLYTNQSNYAFNTDRHLRCMVANNWSYTAYLDWQLYANWYRTWTLNNKPIMNLWWSSYYTSSREAKGKIKDYIVETVARTAQEILDYYNKTKSNYWF